MDGRTDHGSLAVSDHRLFHNFSCTEVEKLMDMKIEECASSLIVEHREQKRIEEFLSNKLKATKKQQ